MSFDQLKTDARRVCQEAGIPERATWIIREIEKAELIYLARKEKEKTGYYITKELRQRIKGKIHLSDRTAENIIYSNK